jgi:sec-independent protein translocase protein TatC
MMKKKSSLKEMSFWDHIFELRRRIITVLIFLILFSFVGYYLFPYLVKMMIEVLKEELYATLITEGFLTRLKVSVIIGAILTIPVFLFEILAFILPALTKKEKIFILSAVSISLVLFILGVIFSYKIVLPFSISYLKSSEFFPEHVKRIISYEKFISFFFQFLLAFGLCFEFPVILLALLKLGVIKFSFLIKNFRFFIVAIFIIAAVLTPPDVQSQILMAVPLILLYLLTILIAKIFKLGK